MSPRRLRESQRKKITKIFLESDSEHFLYSDLSTQRNVARVINPDRPEGRRDRTSLVTGLPVPTVATLSPSPEIAVFDKVRWRKVWARSLSVTVIIDPED